MPKKTKAQKIAALQRKKQFFLNPTVTTLLQKSQNIQTVEVEPIEQHEDSRLKHFFIYDLRKSIILISAIISLEVILYIIKR